VSPALAAAVRAFLDDVPAREPGGVARPA